MGPWDGVFYMAVRLPVSVDMEKAEFTCDHDVLTIVLRKLEDRKAKRLEIKVGSVARLL